MWTNFQLYTGYSLPKTGACVGTSWTAAAVVVQFLMGMGKSISNWPVLLTGGIICYCRAFTPGPLQFKEWISRPDKTWQIKFIPEAV
jgi:hypothetical protein